MARYEYDELKPLSQQPSRHMNFNQRLLTAFIGPAALFVAGLAASIWSLGQTQSKLDRYIATEQATASGLQDMYAQGLQMGQVQPALPTHQPGRSPHDACPA